MGSSSGGVPQSTKKPGSIAMATAQLWGDFRPTGWRQDVKYGCTLSNKPVPYTTGTVPHCPTPVHLSIILLLINIYNKTNNQVIVTHIFKQI